MAKTKENKIYTVMDFETISNYDVMDMVEEKNGSKYLSWAKAWKTFCGFYPGATYEILRNENGTPEFGGPKFGYMVYTTVTADGVTREMQLPVMDGANKPMKDVAYKYQGWKYQGGKRVPVEKTCEPVDMFDINKAVMRCLAKNLAMFGLGINLWTGEDYPEDLEEMEQRQKANAVLKLTKAGCTIPEEQLMQMNTEQLKNIWVKLKEGKKGGDK